MPLWPPKSCGPTRPPPRATGSRLAAAQRAGRRVLREPHGGYTLWRRDDVLAAMRDGEVFGTRQGELMPGNLPFGPYREILLELFNPGSSREMLKPVRGLAEECIGDIAARLNRCDGVQVADVLCRAASMSACGLPPQVPLETVSPVVVGKIRRAPLGGADVITRLATEPLSDDEVLGLMGSVVRGFMFASFPIKAGLAVLARRPVLQQELRESPGRQSHFIEELLRLDGGAKTVSRITTRSVTVGETTIPAGCPVELCVGLVHRDETDEMSGHDMKLEGAHRHWSFGGGPHRCPASHLARELLGDFFAVWLAEIPFFGFDWNGGDIPRAWHPRPYGPFSGAVFDGWVPGSVPLTW
ncbi:cytochrome P450 [Mycobacterium montefiorense]|uniref:cytochrome P450 n=2 Tax=Mycobacterium montefiorense TaxID=154654 RepID=UPI0021F29BCF|nr:cytochrome P450 [Mycobacterium montefiorense]MCV7428530.1 cytochrome P450 [Mycobacterium montefiorense]